MRFAITKQTKCARCGQTFSYDSGYRKYCSSCRPDSLREKQRLAMRKYYKLNPQRMRETVKHAMAKNPEYYRTAQREYGFRFRENVILTALGHYSGGKLQCACCGEAELDFLTIDHISGNGNKERLKVMGRMGGGYRFYDWLIKNGFPAGYQVLCMNCNLSKGKHGTCAHKQTSSRIGLSVGAKE